MLRTLLNKYFSTKAQKREQLRQRLINVWAADNITSHGEAVIRQYFALSEGGR